jgi:DNA helicase-2/ATP-dependent DNA helicase PcrA
MSKIKLTSEQEAVIHHPFGRHARVLAVAGSGKTITMAYRIKHLVMEHQVNPSNIRVLMFNRLARKQFQCRLEKEARIPSSHQPQVHTFHSFCYQFIQKMSTAGMLPSAIDFWLDGRSELIWLYINIAISNLERRKALPPDRVDPDEASEAIQLWKGSLIPPPRAGYRGNPYIPLVYEEFEKLRMQQNALTYDDFIPLTVGILETEQAINRQWCNRADHVIVDEYQDVNYGQQRLIELLAGQRADVMVIGDDDQTIYEWRGARPSYIIREYQTVFANKPHVDYKLSRSFRFGPVIAQCAHNTISFNTTRVEKPLIAHFAGRPAQIHIIEGSSGQTADVNKELATQVVALVKGGGVKPEEIKVLVRMFAQLSGLEAEFLARRIPYRVRGQAPFFERREIRVLLDYIKLAIEINHPVSKQAEEQLLFIANTPSRMLPREALRRAMEAARFQGATTKQALMALVDSPETPLIRLQRERVIELATILERTGERVACEPGLLAGDLLAWLVDSLGYLEHFDNYYGDGEDAFDRKHAVLNFIVYATGTRFRPLELVEHIRELDTTQGAPEDQQIEMTTVFRVKGLEYDYVFIPQCVERYMPCLYGTGNRVFDAAGFVKEPEPSEAIENERRLFYVAITRAKREVYIGTASSPTQGYQGQSFPNLPSRFLDEVQLQPTVEVMSALQRFASGVKQAKNDLVVSVTRFGGLRRIMRSLITGYLLDIGDKSLVGKVVEIVATSPESPFAYRFAYSPPELVGRRNPPPPEPLHRAWDEVRF